MDKDTWLEYVKSYNGAFVLWIDQSTDTLLLTANSEGVCLAMTMDFVTSFQVGKPLPFKFVNGIRDIGLIPPGDNRIPQKYLDLQNIYQEMHTQYRQNLIQLNTQLELAQEKDKPVLLKTIKGILADRIKQQFGPGMTSYEKFKETNVMASITIFQHMQASVEKDGPCYFLVSMRGAKGGHAIAFGFRPDLSASEKFPGIFHYFDANLGMFVFGTEKNLSEFFNVEVWSELYGLTDYTKFEIVAFKATLGQF